MHVDEVPWSSEWSMQASVVCVHRLRPCRAESLAHTATRTATMALETRVMMPCSSSSRMRMLFKQVRECATCHIDICLQKPTRAAVRVRVRVRTERCCGSPRTAPRSACPTPVRVFSSLAPPRAARTPPLGAESSPHKEAQSCGRAKPSSTHKQAQQAQRPCCERA